jgi:hypothetical protein
MDERDSIIAALPHGLHEGESMSLRRPSAAWSSMVAFCALPIASISFSTSFAEFDFAAARDRSARPDETGVPDGRDAGSGRTDDSQTEPL